MLNETDSSRSTKLVMLLAISLMLLVTLVCFIFLNRFYLPTSTLMAQPDARTRHHERQANQQRQEGYSLLETDYLIPIPARHRSVGLLDTGHSTVSDASGSEQISSAQNPYPSSASAANRYRNAAEKLATIDMQHVFDVGGRKIFQAIAPPLSTLNSLSTNEWKAEFKSLRKSIILNVNTAITNVATAQDITLVLDISAKNKNGDQILYLESSPLDITDDVIAEIESKPYSYQLSQK